MTYKEFLNTNFKELSEKHGMSMDDFFRSVYDKSGTMMYGSVSQYNVYVAWLREQTPLAKALK